MKKVLVTGATGFIGRHSLRPLQERGYEVHAIYFEAPLEDKPFGIAEGKPEVIWHQGNLLDADSIRAICEEVKASHLLHFAWYVNPKDYKTSPENEKWVTATLSLLQAFRTGGGTRAVLAGSCIEYDWNVAEEFYVENKPAQSHDTAYGRAKSQTHRLAMTFSSENNVSLAWGRIFFLYGPYEASTRLVPYVITSLVKGEPALLSSGDQLRDFMYVKDVADAFTSLLDSEVTGAVNICSGIALPVKDLVLNIAQALGKTDLVRFGAKPDRDEPARIAGDIHRLKDEVGWQPRYSLDQGIQETVEWWSKNGR